MQIQTFKLSLVPDDYPTNVPVVYANQYDEGRTFTAQIIDADGNPFTPNGESATIRGTKPDGTGFTYSLGALSDSTVTFALTGQMTVVHGAVRCGIILTKNSTVVGTLVFVLYVQPAALQADTIISSDDFGSIITDAVTDWMDEHGIPIDDTLTQPGAAADAGATGARIDQVEADTANGLLVLSRVAGRVYPAAGSDISIVKNGTSLAVTIPSSLYLVRARTAGEYIHTITAATTSYTVPSGSILALMTDTDAISVISAADMLTNQAKAVMLLWNNGGSPVGQWAVYAELGDLKSALENVSGLSPEAKAAILNCFAHTAWIDANGQTYYNTLVNAFKTLTSITAVFTQGAATIYDSDTLSDLTQYLVVTAHYDDNTSAVIPSAAYTLSGSLTAGTSTITVSYGGKTTTFSVTVTHDAESYSITNTLNGCTSSNSATSISDGSSYSATIAASSGYTLTGATVSITMGGTDITSTAYSSGTISIASVTGALVITITAVEVVLSSISAVYTQSGTVYTTDSLDSLKTDLVVTATYSDSSSSVVPSTDYTLSGTLTEGTSTVTVTYGGKTTSFTVTVTAALSYEYSLSNGQLVKINASTAGSISGHPGIIEFNTRFGSTRRSFPTLQGVDSLKDQANNYSDSIYYPIPIPPDAVKAVVSITPATQYHGESIYTYNSETGYTRMRDPGWKQGEYTHTFTAGEFDYITVASKYDSAGSSYPEEPTELSVVFLTS